MRALGGLVLLAAEEFVEEAHRVSPSSLWREVLTIRGKKDQKKGKKMPDPASPKAYRI